MIFPNPGNGWLNMRIKDDWQPPFRFRVFNANGRLVAKAQETDQAIQLDLTTLPTGMYTLEIANDSNREVRKFVVN